MVIVRRLDVSLEQSTLFNWVNHRNSVIQNYKLDLHKDYVYKYLHIYPLCLYFYPYSYFLWLNNMNTMTNGPGLVPCILKSGTIGLEFDLFMCSYTMNS